MTSKLNDYLFLATFLAITHVWDYEHQDKWPEVNCKKAIAQSPIDLRPNDMVPIKERPMLFLNWDNLYELSMMNNGHTIVLTLPTNQNITFTEGGLPGTYELVQFHFHWGSEHTLNGKRFCRRLFVRRGTGTFPFIQSSRRGTLKDSPLVVGNKRLKLQGKFVMADGEDPLSDSSEITEVRTHFKCFLFWVLYRDDEKLQRNRPKVKVREAECWATLYSEQALEAHFVGFNNKFKNFGEALTYANGIAVLGILYELADWGDNAVLQTIIKEIKNLKPIKKEVNVQLNPINFLPKNTNRFYRYFGSLTTPNCNDVVVWTVFSELSKVSQAQVNEFRSISNHEGGQLTENFRNLQPLNGRSVFKAGVN